MENHGGALTVRITEEDRKRLDAVVRPEAAKGGKGSLGEAVRASTRFSTVLKQKCPRCLQGKVFAGLFTMHRWCPQCGLEFEREPGYFVGAMYLSYSLGLIALAPVWLVMRLLGRSIVEILLVISFQLIMCSPLFFRYARVLWLHFDYLIDPR